jgi:hypothetical protein
MTLPAVGAPFPGPSSLGLDDQPIEERSCHFDSRIEDKAQAHIVPVLAAAVGVGVVEDNGAYHQMSPFAAVVAALPIYMTGSASPVDRGSWLGMNLGCRYRQCQMATYCCTVSAIETLAAPRARQELEMGFLVRLTKTPWYTKSENSRSRWTMIRVSQVNQPGVMRYLMNMPVAAGAKARRATYHSHTTSVGQRDGCKTVRRKVPGFALAISMGVPAFRLEEASPRRTVDDRTNEEFAGHDTDAFERAVRLVVRLYW